MRRVGKIKGRWAAEDAKLRRGSADLVNYRAAMQLSLSSILGVSSFGGNLRMPQFLNIGSAPSAVGSGRDTLKIYGGETIGDYIASLTGIDQFGGRGDLMSWEGEKDIDPLEWNALLNDIGADIHSSSIKLGWYDTPFFNGLGLFSGRACINEMCLNRSELNYIGEGEALAARGLSVDQAHETVWWWKTLIWRHDPSQGDYNMTDIGWHYYNSHYTCPVSTYIEIQPDPFQPDPFSLNP